MRYIEDIENRRYVENYDLKPQLKGTVLKLEITNICNHACIVCPHSKFIRQARMMDDNLVRRLIEEAGKEGISKIAFFLNGEPFLNPLIADYVEYSKKCKIPYSFITTNATGFPVNRVLAAMDAGLDSLKISINGGTRETYAKVHNQDCFDEAIKNLMIIRQHRDQLKLNCRILTGFIITNETKSEIKEYYHMIKEYVDDIVFSFPDNFAGYMLENEEHSKGPKPEEVPFFDFSGPKELPCELLFNSINVTAEGYLAACCSEAGTNLLVEDINTRSLREAWHSEKMVTLRRRHIDGKINGIQCEQCANNSLVECIQPLNSELARKIKFKNK